MQLNHTILEAFDGLQIQRHVAGTSRYQWNAIPNEHRGHTDDELVDRLLVKKAGDEVVGQFGSWLVSFTPWLQPGGSHTALAVLNRLNGFR